MSGFFHGVTVTNVDTGARNVSLPSSSIIGLVDTFTEGAGATAKAGDLVLITNEREAVAAFGAGSAISNLIGTGITPQPRLLDKALRKAIQELWEDWVDESDADERTDFYGQQALVARTVEQSGECFVRLRPRRLEDGLAVPLQVQCLAPEFVPHDKFEVTRSGNTIRAGIEFNGIGRRGRAVVRLAEVSEALLSGLDPDGEKALAAQFIIVR